MDQIDTPLDADTHLIRHRVEQLQRDYVHTIDDGAIDRWPEFFTERCLYVIIARDNLERGQELGVMRFESRAMLVDRTTATIGDILTYTITYSASGTNTATNF